MLYAVERDVFIRVSFICILFCVCMNMCILCFLCVFWLFSFVAFSFSTLILLVGSFDL